MATHSSILAWKIPQTKESSGLQFMGSQRVRHNWSTVTFTTLFKDFNCIVVESVFHQAFFSRIFQEKSAQGEKWSLCPKSSVHFPCRENWGPREGLWIPGCSWRDLHSFREGVEVLSTWMAEQENSGVERVLCRWEMEKSSCICCKWKI